MGGLTVVGAVSDVAPVGRLRSATPSSLWRTGLRADPYWDGLWAVGEPAQWVNRARHDRAAAAGLAGVLPRSLRADPAAAAARLGKARVVWRAGLDLLGVVGSWRTVTVQQAAAFTGNPHVGSPDGHALGDLFASGVLDVGWAGAVSGGPLSPRVRLVRPSAGNMFDRTVGPLMTWPEWVSVTGGGPWVTGGQFDRHNILTAELALRVAEFLPVGAVLGERQAGLDVLGWEGAGVSAPGHGSHARADAVVVTRSGVRVAVEMTASSAQDLQVKADRWCRILEARPFAQTGLVVLFVTAGRAGVHGSHTSPRQLLAQVRRRLARAVRDHPGVRSARTADRVFVADWGDWFPSRGMVSRGFMRLRAARPTGAGDDVWEDADVLDEDMLPAPSCLADPLAVVSNTAGLRCVPWWLRTGVRGPNLAGMQVRRAGFDTPPTVEVDGRTGVRRRSAGRGAAGAAVLPARLASCRSITT